MTYRNRKNSLPILIFCLIIRLPEIFLNIKRKRKEDGRIKRGKNVTELPSITGYLHAAKRLATIHVHVSVIHCVGEFVKTPRYTETNLSRSLTHVPLVFARGV